MKRRRCWASKLGCGVYLSRVCKRLHLNGGSLNLVADSLRGRARCACVLPQMPQKSERCLPGPPAQTLFQTLFGFFGVWAGGTFRAWRAQGPLHEASEVQEHYT